MVVRVVSGQLRCRRGRGCSESGCSAAGCRSEVEKYYVSAGYLFPAYHGGYWIGLQVSAAALLICA
jgi:hypothetical protein